jgi:hypothetical protein
MAATTQPMIGFSYRIMINTVFELKTVSLMIMNLYYDKAILAGAEFSNGSLAAFAHSKQPGSAQE